MNRYVLPARFNKEADAGYIYFKPSALMIGKIAKTVTIAKDIVVDYDSQGRICGIEILSSDLLDLEAMEKFNVLTAVKDEGSSDS